jgi:hypothetical protein
VSFMVLIWWGRAMVAGVNRPLVIKQKATTQKASHHEPGHDSRLKVRLSNPPRW